MHKPQSHPAPRVIIFANRKGGSGKTTLAVNLAAALGQAGKRVLVADLDPQCHATYISGVDSYNAEAAVKLALALRAGQPERGIVRPEHGLFDVLPGYHSSKPLPGAAHTAEINLSTLLVPGENARILCAPLFVNYDFVLLDTPPSGEDALRFAVSVATEVIIPLPLHFLAMEGLAQLIGLLRRHAVSLNPDLTLCGVVPVMTDAREEHSSKVLLQLREIFPDTMLLRRIRMDMCLAEAAWQQLPALCLFPNSKGVADAADLAAHVLAATRQMPFCRAQSLVEQPEHASEIVEPPAAAETPDSPAAYPTAHATDSQG